MHRIWQKFSGPTVAFPESKKLFPPMPNRAKRSPTEQKEAKRSKKEQKEAKKSKQEPTGAKGRYLKRLRAI